MSEILRRADDALASASQEIAQAEKLLTIAMTVRWLAKRGVIVGRNTVRHWCDRGAVPWVRLQRKHQRAIPLTTLEHIAACPLCLHRLSN